jgi:hypothetical protein
MTHRRKRQRKPVWIVILAAIIVVAAAAGVAIGRQHQTEAAVGPMPVHLPHAPESYLGVYSAAAPRSYSGVTAFTQATGVTPDLAMYYSSWYEGFRKDFAMSAEQHGAVPVVQLEPAGISLRAIAAGKYDAFLSEYASAVSAYRRPVILSFGHEMNGSWYTWGFRRTPAAEFVAAWRHIVTLFRSFGAKNVTWLWTVNVIDTADGSIPSPRPWWPGDAYVTWVGIDGYYLKAPWTFAPLFGPTIAAVKLFTHDPILISETGASPEAGKPAKIANLFAGIHAYGLLGFVWFNSVGVRDWRLNSPAALTAFREAAQTSYKRPR